MKSLYLFNCLVLWPSFGHNVRAQRRPTVPPVGARQRSNIHRFPHSAHEPPACLSVHTSDFSQHQPMRRVSETQSNAPVKKLFEQLRTNSARSAMDQSRWWVRSREQGWVNSRERQGRLGAQRQNVTFEARLRACGSAVVSRNRFNGTWVRWWETTQQADIISSRSSICSPSKRHGAEDNAMPRCHAIPLFKIEGFIITAFVASHATIGV